MSGCAERYILPSEEPCSVVKNTVLSSTVVFESLGLRSGKEFYQSQFGLESNSLTF
jgi:hypothetical protein